MSFQPNFNQLIDSRGGPQTVQCHNDCVKDINELYKWSMSEIVVVMVM